MPEKKNTWNTIYKIPPKTREVAAKKQMKKLYYCTGWTLARAPDRCEIRRNKKKPIQCDALQVSLESRVSPIVWQRKTNSMQWPTQSTEVPFYHAQMIFYYCKFILSNLNAFLFSFFYYLKTHYLWKGEECIDQVNTV